MQEESVYPSCICCCLCISLGFYVSLSFPLSVSLNAPVPVSLSCCRSGAFGWFGTGRGISSLFPAKTKALLRAFHELATARIIPLDISQLLTVQQYNICGKSPTVVCFCRFPDNVVSVVVAALVLRAGSPAGLALHQLRVERLCCLRNLCRNLACVLLNCLAQRGPRRSVVCRALVFLGSCAVF